MTLSKKFEAIRQAVRKSNQSALSRETGLHENTLRAANNPKWNPRAKTLVKLDEALRDE